MPKNYTKTVAVVFAFYDDASLPFTPRCRCVLAWAIDRFTYIGRPFWILLFQSTIMWCSRGKYILICPWACHSIFPNSRNQNGRHICKTVNQSPSGLGCFQKWVTQPFKNFSFYYLYRFHWFILRETWVPIHAPSSVWFRLNTRYRSVYLRKFDCWKKIGAFERWGFEVRFSRIIKNHHSILKLWA